MRPMGSGLESSLKEAVRVDLDDAATDGGADEVHLLCAERDGVQFGDRSIEGRHPERREELVSHPALKASDPEAVSDSADGGSHRLADLTDAPLKVAGNRPGSAGVTGDFIQGVVVHADIDRLTKRRRELVPDTFTADAERKHVLSRSAKKGVSGQCAKMGDLLASLRVGVPEMTQYAIKEKGRIQAVELTEALIREDPIGHCALAEDIVVDDRPLEVLALGGRRKPTEGVT